MHAAYAVLVALHVGCAVVGFGTLAIGGIYGFTGRSSATDAGTRDESARWFATPSRTQWLVVAVPFLGIAALAVEPGGAGPGQLWAGLAVVVWAVAVAVWWFVSRPAEAVLRSAVAAAGDRRAWAATGPADPAGWSAAAQRVGVASAVTDVAFGVGLVLMILQPR